MPYSIGVDLGASFTAVAIADELGTHAAQLSPLLVVPSAVYLASDGALITGDAALRAGEADPSRLVRGFKKRLGDPTPLNIAGVQYTPEKLMAAQLRDVVAEVAEQRGEPAQSIVLTHPVTWGPYRTEHFSRVAEHAGIDVRATITEPVATATHLDTQGSVKDGDVVAIVDFGADAVTATLLRKDATGFSILGTPEDVDQVASADFDDAMRTLLDQKLGGMISAIDPTDPASLALLAGIENTCSTAKEALSVRRETTASVELADGVHRLPVTREEFERLIRPSVRLVVEALRRTISSAEIDDDAVKNIVLTGGASRIPLVAEELAEMERPVRTIHHPKLTVALGGAHTARALAIADASPEADATADGHTDVSPSSRSSARWWPLSRRAWITIAIVCVVFLAGAAAALLVPALSGDSAMSAPPASASTAPQTKAGDTEVVSPEAAPKGGADSSANRVSPVFDDGTTTPGLRWHIASAEADNAWGVAELHNGVAEMPSIALAITDGALRAQWSSPDWISQFYVQLSNEVLDLREIAAEDGALVFDLTVLSGSASSFEVAAHCVFPCGGSVDITDTVSELDPNKTAHMVVPAACFTRDGLDITLVNTPFLLLGQGDIAVKVENIRWENKSGANADAITC